MLSRTKPDVTAAKGGQATKKKGEQAKKSPKLAGQKKNKGVKKEAGGGSGVRGQSQSCHQCRQSIHSSKGVSEVKSGRERLKCSRCTRYWCEQCLHNRYGVVKSEQDPTSFVCPVCSDNCNCSLCRKKAGKLATGILTPLIKSAGFGNVSDFLDKGTDDIAKVLQWKSPEIDTADTTSQTKKKRRLESSTASGGQSHSKRKKRTQHDDVENSTSITNTPSPVSSCHGNGRAHTGSGKRSNGQCRHGNGRPKRRRRLSHSSYSITVEDDPADLVESSEQAKLTVSATFSPLVSMETNDNGTATAVQPIKTETSEDNVASECSTLPEPRSEVKGNLSSELGSPFRRSQRKRSTTRRYSSHDFRPDVDEEDILFPSPKSKRRRSCGSEREKRVSFRSPPFSPKSAESADDGDASSGHVSVEVIQKQKELEELKNSTLSCLRETKKVSQQEVTKEKERLREEAQRRRREEKQRLSEEKAKLREEKKLNKLASQEKLKLARNLLREAQKDARRRQKEREKVRKQKELHLLKEKRQEEKRKRHELTSAPIIQLNQKVSSLEDDSPTDCESAGLPRLPDLPALELPFSSDVIPTLLFVSEFLFTFADALELKRKLTLKELSKLMAGGRGLGDLYLSLLKVLVDEDSQLQKQLKPPKRQRDLELLARTYLHDVGKNGFIQSRSSGGQSLQESLIILHHLCEEALDSAAVTEHMEACHEQIDQLRRDERQREREKSREISEQLKKLCDGGTCSMDDIEAKRKEFTRELEEMRRSSEQEQFSCRRAIRNTFLGRDRYNRIFWKLQSFPGLLVEVLSSHGEGEESSTFDDEDGGPGSGQWLVVNSADQLEEIMGCLHPRGKREGQLLNSLILHKDDIATQLGDSAHQSRVKKFYG